jgi:hypothetical protein
VFLLTSLCVLIVLLFIILSALAFQDISSVISQIKRKHRCYQLLEESIQREFPIGKECVFTGKYVSHWEIARFVWFIDGLIPSNWENPFNSGLNCELVIPFEGGWSWRVEALSNPSTREGWSGIFDLTFRGKILEKGCFGHIGICSYRVEVVEILAVKKLSP